MKVTTLVKSIHSESDSPIFGESATHITLEDEGGGWFVKISQCHDDIEPGVVKLDKEELRLVMETALQMLSEE